MADAEQTALLAAVVKHWKDNSISAPKVKVYELERADQWPDWRFKIKSHFMCY